MTQMDRLVALRAEAAREGHAEMVVVCDRLIGELT